MTILMGAGPIDADLEVDGDLLDEAALATTAAAVSTRIARLYETKKDLLERFAFDDPDIDTPDSAPHH